MKIFETVAVILMVSVMIGCGDALTPEPQGYTISGAIDGVGDGEAQLMHLNLNDNETVIVDTAVVSDGAFRFEGRVDHPYFYTVKINDSISSYFFLENSDISLSGTADSIHVSGSSEDSLLSSYVFSDIFEKEVGLDIVLNHPETHVAAFTAFYLLQIHDFTSDTLEMIMKGFSPEVQRSEYYAQLDTLYQTISRVAVGNVAPDFTIPDMEGEAVTLSDKRGGYVLVDFWASWCAPCRKANPGLVRVYDEFRGEGFEVVGVSVDKNRKSWLKAIDDDGLEWINLSNCAGWDNESKSYGVKSIPQNFLLDPDGKIIGKNLSEEQLTEALAEVYH